MRTPVLHIHILCTRNRNVPFRKKKRAKTDVASPRNTWGIRFLRVSVSMYSARYGGAHHNHTRRWKLFECVLKIYRCGTRPERIARTRPYNLCLMAIVFSVIMREDDRNKCELETEYNSWMLSPRSICLCNATHIFFRFASSALLRRVPDKKS